MYTQHYNTTRYIQFVCPPVATARQCTYKVVHVSERRAAPGPTVDTGSTARFAAARAAKHLYSTDRRVHYTKVTHQHTTRTAHTAAKPTVPSERIGVFTPGFATHVQLVEVLLPVTCTSSRRADAEVAQPGDCFFTLRTSTSRWCCLQYRTCSETIITLCITDIHLLDSLEITEAVTKHTQLLVTYISESIHTQRSATLSYTATSDIYIAFYVPIRKTVDTAVALSAFTYQSDKNVYVQSFPAYTQRFAFLDRYYGTGRTVVTTYTAEDYRKAIAYTYTECTLDTILCIYGGFKATSRIVFTRSSAAISTRKVFTETRNLYKENTPLTSLNTFSVRPRDEQELRVRFVLLRKAEIHTNAQQTQQPSVSSVEAILHDHDKVQVHFAGTDTLGAKLSKKSTSKKLLLHTTSVLTPIFRSEHTLFTAGYKPLWDERTGETSAHCINFRTAVASGYVLRYCEHNGITSAHCVDYRHVTTPQGFYIYTSERGGYTLARIEYTFSDRTILVECAAVFKPSLPIFSYIEKCYRIYTDIRKAWVECVSVKASLPLFSKVVECKSPLGTDRKVRIECATIRTSLPIFATRLPCRSTTERTIHFRCMAYTNTLPIFAAKIYCEPQSFSDKRYADYKCVEYLNTLPIFSFKRHCVNTCNTDRKVFIKPVKVVPSLPLFVEVERQGLDTVAVSQSERTCCYQPYTFMSERNTVVNSIAVRTTERSITTAVSN